MFKRFRILTAVTAGLLLVLSGCAQTPGGGGTDTDPQETQTDQTGEGGRDGQETSDETGDPLAVVTSFTILADMVQEVGGSHVTVHNLVPTGTDPHEYEPLPADLSAVADADLLFYNGLNLEGGDSGWLARMIDAVGLDSQQTVETSQEIEPMFLSGRGSDNSQDSAGRAEEINPHGFTDPNNGILMVEAIVAALKDSDPSNAAVYDENAAQYLSAIKQLETEYAESLAKIPDDERILVTSERAFQYLAARYNIKEAYLWEVDTDENGSAEQIKNLLEFLKTNDVKNLVLESNVDPRPMQTVSKESGVPIYERYIYSDEIGDAKNPDGDTYLSYLQNNLEVIVGSLR